jgi:hypothetical protein
MMARRSLSALLLLAAALLSVVTLASTADAPSRVVAIGDVHGAYTEFLAILRQTKLVDARGRWSGGHATLVQTGDLVDRGEHVRATLDLVMDLVKQAPKAGGSVIPLLGNHEAMNVLGDVRDVTPQIYRTFATPGSEQVRNEAFEDYIAFLSAHAGHVHSLLVPTDEAGVAKWADEYPLGYFEYRDAFGPNGKYGRWLRHLHAVAQVGDGLFVHGGLNPTLPFENAAEVNTKVTAELNEFDRIWQSLSSKKVIWRYMKLEPALAHLTEELKQLQAQPKPADPAVVAQIQKLLGYSEWMTISANGPLWYRGLTTDTEPEFTAAFDALLTRFGARYMVVGHTPMPKNTITPWLGGRLLAIDTGMLSEVFKGRASALEIEGDRFTAIYSDGTSQVLDSPSRAPAKPSDAW